MRRDDRTKKLSFLLREWKIFGNATARSKIVLFFFFFSLFDQGDRNRPLATVVTGDLRSERNEFAAQGHFLWTPIESIRETPSAPCHATCRTSSSRFEVTPFSRWYHATRDDLSTRSRLPIVLPLVRKEPSLKRSLLDG